MAKRKSCRLCGKDGTKKAPVTKGSPTGNLTLAKCIIHIHSLGDESLDPLSLGWSGKDNDYQSIADYLDSSNACFHSACRRKLCCQIPQEPDGRRSVASAPEASSANEEVDNTEELSVIHQDVPEGDNDTDEIFELGLQRKRRRVDTTSTSPGSISTPPGSIYTPGSVWTPGSTPLPSSSDVLNTPTRTTITSRQRSTMNILLKKMETENQVFSVSEMFDVYNGLVLEIFPENQRDEQKFSSEKDFLFSVKTYIGHSVHIEHDLYWKNTFICAKSSLFSILKRSFDLRKSKDFVKNHPGLQQIRHSIVNSANGGRFNGTFTSDVIHHDNVAPKKLRRAVSYLCYGVADVESYDVLCLANAIFFNHRKKPNILKVVSSKGCNDNLMNDFFFHLFFKQNSAKILLMFLRLFNL